MSEILASFGQRHPPGPCTSLFFPGGVLSASSAVSRAPLSLPAEAQPPSSPQAPASLHTVSNTFFSLKPFLNHVSPVTLTPAFQSLPGLQPTLTPASPRGADPPQWPLHSPALAAVLVPEPPWPQSRSLSRPGRSHGHGTAAGATLSRSSQASQPLSEYVPPSVSLHWSGALAPCTCAEVSLVTRVSGSRTGLRKTAGANGDR